MGFLIIFLMACLQFLKNLISPIVNHITVCTSNTTLSSIFLATCIVLLQDEYKISPFQLGTKSFKIVAVSREEFFIWF